MLEPPAGVTALLVALAVVALLPVVPAVRAFGDDRKRARCLAAAARAGPAQAASGREHAHTAMGYGLAVLICAGLVWFTTANDGAITTTFLRWEFLPASFADVLDAFWINIEVAVGAQVLVLVFGLVVAIMRLLPGRAGRPAAVAGDRLRRHVPRHPQHHRALPGRLRSEAGQVPFFRDLSPVWLAIIALTLTYSATSPRSTGPASSRSTRASGRRPARWACPTG